MRPLSCWSDLSIYLSLDGRQKLYKHTVYSTWIRVGHLQALFTINMPTWCIYKGSQFRILELVWEGSFITVTDFKQPKVTQKCLLFLLWWIMMSDLAWLSSSGCQCDCYTVPAIYQAQDNSQGWWNYHSGQKKRKWAESQHLTTKNTSRLQKKSLRTQGNRKDKIQLKGGLATLREVLLGPLSVVMWPGEMEKRLSNYKMVRWVFFV